jgi:hypothetical protein
LTAADRFVGRVPYQARQQAGLAYFSRDEAIERPAKSESCASKTYRIDFREDSR